MDEQTFVFLNYDKCLSFIAVTTDWNAVDIFVFKSVDSGLITNLITVEGLSSLILGVFAIICFYFIFLLKLLRLKFLKTTILTGWTPRCITPVTTI
jgi:hypothetical protein